MVRTLLGTLDIFKHSVQLLRQFSVVCLQSPFYGLDVSLEVTSEGGFGRRPCVQA